MLDAEKENQVISAEVNLMENYKKLQEMKDFEELEMNSDFSLSKKPSALAKLPTLNAPV